MSNDFNSMTTDISGTPRVQDLPLIQGMRVKVADSTPPTPTPKTSRNIYIMLVLCVLWGFSDSIWSGTIIVAWVQLLAGGEDAKHSNSKVGYVEATQGLAMLLTALPVGYIADKYSRQVVIRAGGVGFIIATLLTLAAVLNPYLWSTDKQYLLILVSMAFWGIGQGIFNGPSQALFADSIPQGERTKWYSRLMMCYLIPSIAGPVAAIVLLTMYGDHWSFDELRPVFLFGVLAELPPVVLSFFMRDDLALNNGGDKKKEEKDVEKENVVDEETGAMAATEGEVNESKEEGEGNHDTATTATSTSGCCTCVLKKHVPYILFASSLLTALGSGMTIKFFPLFFKKNLNLSPRGVQCIYALAPLLIAVFTKMNEQVAKCLGRVQTILVANVIGVSLLVSMSVLVDVGYTKWYVIVPIYLFRTGIMNSTYALNESILMDYVPKATRARWKSLESVASFGWCGSAVLGGVLSDALSYSSTFLYTAGLQFMGTMIITLLLWIVPIKEKPASSDSTKDKKGEGGKVVEVEGEERERLVTKCRGSSIQRSNHLEEPLLG